MALAWIGRMLRTLPGRLAAAALVFAAGPAWAKCQLGQVASLPVTMMGMRALLPAKINGQDVQFVVDSGAFYSSITMANADKFKLPRKPLPLGSYITGMTGDADAEVGIVNVLTLADVPLHHLEFLVAGGEVGEGAVGLLGQNILGKWDVEYDLAKGMVKLWEPMGCGDSADMIYWSPTTPGAVIDLQTDDRQYVTHTKGPVYVNGVRLSAIFDTGATVSIMTTSAAARAGLRPNAPGVIASGYIRGIGRRMVQSWIGPVKSFKIGQEEIRNTRMRFSDVELGDADLVIGMDFFLGHHVFVSNRQRKLYLTYNGGPVFNMDQTPIHLLAGEAGAKGSPGAGSAPVPAAGPPEPAEADPTDAAGFARRGAGFAALNQLPQAIADLSKAIDLAPTVADYHFQRGLVHVRNQQPFLAMADFDATLKLKPDDVQALVARANLRLVGHDKVEAVQDLEAADKASAKQDDIRLTIAQLYARADLPPAAIDQYTLWIDAHSEDARLPEALNGRCWQRALSGADLDKALNDCNRAIRNAPKNAAMLDSRGLVELRRGDLDKAIADYDAALALDPKLGWSLYGRGLAKQRKGLIADGAADIAAATALYPRLPDEMRRRGLTP